MNGCLIYYNFKGLYRAVISVKLFRGILLELGLGDWFRSKSWLVYMVCFLSQKVHFFTNTVACDLRRVAELKQKSFLCLKSSVISCKIQPDAWCQRHWICSELSLLFHSKLSTCYTGSVLLQVSRDDINCCTYSHCESESLSRTPRNLKYEVIGDWANIFIALLLHLYMLFFSLENLRNGQLSGSRIMEGWVVRTVEWSPRGVEGCRISCHLGTGFFLSLPV